MDSPSQYTTYSLVDDVYVEMRYRVFGMEIGRLSRLFDIG